MNPSIAGLTLSYCMYTTVEVICLPCQAKSFSGQRPCLNSFISLAPTTPLWYLPRHQKHSVNKHLLDGSKWDTMMGRRWWRCKRETGKYLWGCKRTKKYYITVKCNHQMQLGSAYKLPPALATTLRLQTHVNTPSSSLSLSFPLNSLHQD